MPSRWFVQVPGLDPDRVRLEHLHAAFSHWFDQSQTEHAAADKPYTLSPLARDHDGVTGVEVATLNEVAGHQLAEAVGERRRVRLGAQTCAVGAARLLAQETWSSLADHSADCRWQVELRTPTTFRTGDRSSPLLRPEIMLDGLNRGWSAWSDVDLPAVTSWAQVWVSDLDLRSEVVPLRVKGRDGRRRPVTISGCVGSLTIRCDDEAVASKVGPLLRLASYSGIGSMTRRGLGVTRVTPCSRPNQGWTG